MAFARAKVHWGKMDAEKLVTRGPPEGKEHRKPELYYKSVLKGSYLAAELCTKDIIFPRIPIMLSFVMFEQGCLYVACYIKVYPPVRPFVY